MNQIYLFIQWFSNIFKKLGICATVGFIAGIITGMALLLDYSVTGAVITLTYNETWQVALLLAAFCFLVLLFVLFVLCRYTVSSVFLPTLINCLLTCFFTVYLVNKFAAWEWAVFIGMVVGLIIGYLLCILCRYLGGRYYGMHRA